jgi:hypothetical protein
MDKLIKTIWIESEHKGSIIGGHKYTDDNSDVIVTFSDDKKYVATFFTYDNVKTLTEKNKKTGELLSGKYFWASDMILVDKTFRFATFICAPHPATPHSQALCTSAKESQHTGLPRMTLHLR